MPLVTKRLRTVVTAAAAAALCVGAVAAASPSQSAAPRSAIPGTHPAWANTPERVSAQPVTAGTVTARVYLAGQDPAGLTAYATSVSQPGSALYGHYLTTAQVSARFGPTSAQITAVRSWLTGAGLSVTSVDGRPGGYVAVTGPVTAAAKAFSVTFGTYKGPDHRSDRAPDQAASAPSGVASTVLAVTGLDTASHQMQPRDTLPPPPPNFYTAPPCSDYYGQKIATSEPTAFGKHVPYVQCGYTPAQLRGAYGVTASRLTGKGATVAIVDAYAAPTMPSDANTYSRTFGDHAFRPGQYNQVLPPAFTQTALCGPAGWYGEETLDVEAVHGLAPDANVTYVGAASCLDTDLMAALTTIVDNHLADIVSNSWGEAEDQVDPAAIPAFEQIFKLGAAEGIGFNFSSGDCGYEDPANSCGSARDGSDRIQVDYPTSDPWVTSVGGTSLAVSKSNSYQFETGWGTYRDALSADGKSWTPTPPGSYPASYTSGAGGGTSTRFTQPFYQRGVVPTSLSTRLPDGTTSPTAMREVPDIAAVADPTTGFRVGETVQLANGTYGFALSRIGGTSLASPVIAGVQADAQQSFGHPIGFANPAIYLLSRFGVYHDVTGSPSGLALARNDYTNTATAQGPIIHSLRVLGLDGGGAALLQATKGYDDVTGVGTPSLGYLESYRFR
jgi:subtilase family serine protease